MANNIRKDARNEQHNLYELGNNVTPSGLAFENISISPSCHLENETVGYLENSHQTQKTKLDRDDDLDYANNLSDEDEEMYWDNSVVDLLQVECNEDISDGMELCDVVSTNTRNKIYPIEKYCAICNKEFSVQRDLAKHAQQTHPGEKGFKCKHCPTLFSKLKSVTAHFNRTHSKRRFYSEPSIRATSNFRVEYNASMETNDDVFANRKGKIYPIENKCAVCDMKISLQRDLVKHTQEFHPNDKVFKCLYCPTLFSKLKSVTSHYKRSHSNYKKTIVCEFCNKTFFTQFLLERHRRSHTEIRPYGCNRCTKTYKYKRNLLVHMKTHSKINKSLNSTIDDDYMDEYCENDEENQYSEDEYCANEDENLITGDNYFETNYEEDGIIISGLSLSERNIICQQYPFKCKDCNRVYKYKRNLKSHEKTHHKINEQTSEEIETITLDDTSENEQDNSNCYNNSTYFIIDELNTDSENYEDIGENEFATNFSDEYDHEDYIPETTDIAADHQNECGICMKVFKCQQAVAKHLQRCHAEIEFFKCPYCDDNFYSLDSLSLHITVKKHYQKRNVCEMCLKSFDRKSDLKRHVRTHTDERPYSCDVCNKKFKQSNHLKRHKELNHDTSIKTLKYSCDICMRSFLIEDTLRRHMVIHEKEKQFPCRMCSKVFKTRYDYHRHQETHSSRKNLICEFCLQSFVDMETLELHIRGHTGDRKFICTICEKTFKEKSHLVNHRKSHTNF